MARRKKADKQLVPAARKSSSPVGGDPYRARRRSRFRGVRWDRGREQRTSDPKSGTLCSRHESASGINLWPAIRLARVGGSDPGEGH